MSKIKIQGHSDGVGVLTLTTPNTSTNSTLTLPEGTGSLIADDGSGTVTVDSLIFTEKQTTKTASFTPLFTEGTVYNCSGTMTITMPTATAGKSFTIFHSNATDITWAGTPKWSGGHEPGQVGQPVLSAVAYFTFISDGVSWFGIQKGTAFEAARVFSEVSNDKSIESLQTDFWDGPYGNSSTYAKLAHTPASVAVNPYDLTKGFTVSPADTTGIENIYADGTQGNYDYKTINPTAGTSGSVGSLTDATKYAHDIPSASYGRNGRAVLWSWVSQKGHYNLTDEERLVTKFNYTADDGATWAEHTLAQDLSTYSIDDSSIFGAYFSDSNDELFVIYIRQMSTAAYYTHYGSGEFLLNDNTTTTNIYCDRFTLSTSGVLTLQESTLVVPDTVPNTVHFQHRLSQRNVVAGYQDQILLILPDIQNITDNSDATTWIDPDGLVPAGTYRGEQFMSTRGGFFETVILDISASAAPTIGALFGKQSTNYTNSSNKGQCYATSQMFSVILYGDKLYWENYNTGYNNNNSISTGFTYAMSNMDTVRRNGLTPQLDANFGTTGAVIETTMTTLVAKGHTGLLKSGEDLFYGLFSPVRFRDEQDHRNRRSMRFLPNWLETNKMLVAIDDTTINNFTEAHTIKIWAIDFSDITNITKTLYHTFENFDEVTTIDSSSIAYSQDDALARPNSSIHTNINYDDKVAVISSAYEISYADNDVGYISVYKWE